MNKNRQILEKYFKENAGKIERTAKVRVYKPDMKRRNWSFTGIEWPVFNVCPEKILEQANELLPDYEIFRVEPFLPGYGNDFLSVCIVDTHLLTPEVREAFSIAS